jgi:DNA polymerase III subunit gamma/tau
MRQHRRWASIWWACASCAVAVACGPKSGLKDAAPGAEVGVGSGGSFGSGGHPATGGGPGSGGVGTGGNPGSGGAAADASPTTDVVDTDAAADAPAVDAAPEVAAPNCGDAGPCGPAQACILIGGGPRPPCDPPSDAGTCPPDQVLDYCYGGGTGQQGCTTPRPQPHCAQLADGCGDPCACVCPAPRGAGCSAGPGYTICSLP